MARDGTPEPEVAPIFLGFVGLIVYEWLGVQLIEHARCQGAEQWKSFRSPSKRNGFATEPGPDNDGGSAELSAAPESFADPIQVYGVRKWSFRASIHNSGLHDSLKIAGSTVSDSNSASLFTRGEPVAETFAGALTMEVPVPSGFPQLSLEQKNDLILRLVESYKDVDALARRRIAGQVAAATGDNDLVNLILRS